MEPLSIPEIIAFLQSSFRKTDFDEAARILISREESVRAELENKFSDEMACKEFERVELERELAAIRRRCGELEELAKKTHLGLDPGSGEIDRELAGETEGRAPLEAEAAGSKNGMGVVGEEIEKYKKTQMGFDAEREALKRKLAEETERRALVEAELAELNSRMGSFNKETEEYKETHVGFDAERGVLDRKLAEEKERHASLEAEVAALRGGMSAFEKEIEYYKRTCESLEGQVSRLKKECEVLGKRERKSQERIGFLLGVRKELEEIDELKRTCQELEGKVRQLVDNGTSRGTGEEKHGKTEEERGREHACALPRGEVGSDGMEVAPVKAGGKPVLGEVIEISDGEDEISVKVCDLEQLLKREPSNAKNEACERKSPEMPHSEKRNLDVMEDDTIILAEDSSLVPTPKRHRARRVVTSDSESDDDNVPISRLKMKRLEQLNGGTKESDETQEDVTPSRRRLVSLRRCDKINAGPKGSSTRNVATQDLPTPNSKKETSRNRAAAYRKLEFSDSEDGKDDEVFGGKEEDDGSESEGESLGGFIVNNSDDSSEENDGGNLDPDEGESSSNEEEGSDLELGDVISSFRRERNTKKWEFEADMLSSFANDPELCMKAVCTLYRQQTSDEQSMKGTLHANRRGFNQCDAYRGSMIAEFLMDGDPHGPMKKSVRELEYFDPRGPEYCYKLATHYSKQLFMIYQNNEDPYFCPS